MLEGLPEEGRERESEKDSGGVSEKEKHGLLLTAVSNKIFCNQQR